MPLAGERGDPREMCEGFQTSSRQCSGITCVRARKGAQVRRVEVLPVAGER